MLQLFRILPLHYLLPRKSRYCKKYFQARVIFTHKVQSAARKTSALFLPCIIRFWDFLLSTMFLKSMTRLSNKICLLESSVAANGLTIPLALVIDVHERYWSLITKWAEYSSAFVSKNTMINHYNPVYSHNRKTN